MTTAQLEDRLELAWVEAQGWDWSKSGDFPIRGTELVFRVVPYNSKDGWDSYDDYKDYVKEKFHGFRRINVLKHAGVYGVLVVSDLSLMDVWFYEMQIMELCPPRNDDDYFEGDHQYEQIYPIYYDNDKNKELLEILKTSMPDSIIRRIALMNKLGELIKELEELEESANNNERGK